MLLNKPHKNNANKENPDKKYIISPINPTKLAPVIPISSKCEK